MLNFSFLAPWILRLYWFVIFWICVAFEGGTSDVRVVELPIIDALNPRPPYLPQSIPSDLAERLMRLHGHPFVWWIGQILKYLLRPQPSLVVDMKATGKKLGFYGGPIVG